MQSENKTVNIIESHGRICSIKERPNGEKIVTLFSKSGKLDIYPVFLCPKDINVDYPTHARICIKGYIRTYKNKEKRVVQELIATSVESEKTMTEEAFGEKGKFFLEPKTLVYLKGNIDSFIVEEKWIRIKIKVRSESNKDKSYYINTSFKRPDRMPDFEKGKTISTVCSYTTPKKDIDEKIVYFGNILILDAAIS